MDEKTNQRPSEICSEGAGPEGGEGPEKTGRPAFPLALCEVCTALENRVEERTHRLSEEVEERKRVETALRENEMRFMDFAAAAADRFWETDENHRYIYMSPPPDHHFLDEEKLIGRTRWEIEGMEVDEVTWAEHRADLEARRPFRGFRFAQFRADGGKRHLRLNGKPVFDEEGHFKGYRGTAVDETAEVEARDKEQVIWTRFIDAMEKMSEGVLLWDRENHFVMCNDYFKKLDPEVAKFLVPGIYMEEFLTKLSELSPPAEAVGRTREWISQAMARLNQPFSDYEVFKRGRWIRIRRTRFADGSSVSFHSDITEIKQREERFRQAYKMEAVGQLTGGVSHDFNNLLTIIQGNLELLDSTLGEGEWRQKWTSAALAATRRGAQLTNRLMAFSRKQVLDAAPVDLHHLSAGMIDLLHHSLGEKIETSLDAGEGLWPALVDAAQMENALLNLAINARDAMPDGGSLSIRCANHRLDEAYQQVHAYASVGDFVSLTVSDTGTGMPTESLERAFEPFFTTKDVGQGSGLGLSMIFGFVKQSGGHIEIESREGAGTSVALFLPRATSDAVEIPAEPIGEEIPQGRGEHILLIEDDAKVREVIATTLAGLGYRVVDGGDGKQALDKLSEDEAIKLIIADIVLPGGLSGPGIAAQATGRHAGIGVLLMTGYADEDRFAEGGDAAGFPCLMKPFKREDLAKRVRELIDGAGLKEDGSSG